MEQDRKRKVLKVILVCIVFIFLAAVMEYTDKELNESNKIKRNDPGENSKEISLILSGEGVEKQEYDLEIHERKLTESEAQEYFEEAILEINDSFYLGEENANYVTEKVNPSDKYVEKMVKADWTFSENIISDDGVIDEDRLEKYEDYQQGVVVTAQVELQCQDYVEEYDFHFVVFPKKLSEQEQIIKQIEQSITEQLSIPGEEIVVLPDEIGGNKLSWKEVSQHLVAKVIVVELIVIILICIIKQKKKSEELKKRKKDMELEYSEIVSKMAILLGSGMSVKQTWSNISARYLDKREKNQVPEIPIYEEMLITEREINDGKSERIAYQNFSERVNIMCYHRLIRLLISSLDRGSRHICENLEQESEEAFEERKAVARRLGEEASTKMLVPMMIMMSIVIAVIIVPAILSFQ